MSESMNLITAQIAFLEPQLALIHIPIQLYSFLLQPILRLLFGEDHDEDAAKVPWTSRHDFLNVSITPVECSVICTRQLADRFIRPAAEVLNKIYASDKKSKSKKEVHISPDDFIVVQVDGQGLDAGQRVLELTSPLAMIGISIFFITTYFSDYILVPSRYRRTVTKALEDRGFVFSQTAEAFVSQISPASPIQHQPGRPLSSAVGNEDFVPSTPPAKDIPELQIRTFTKLKRSNITPAVDRSIRLANCAGSREPNPAGEEQLKNDLLQVLLATSSIPLVANSKSASSTKGGLGINASGKEEFPPLGTPDFSAKFLSITITSTEPISILLEHKLLDRLGSSLLGAKSDDDVLIPIILDLRELPLDATGIVCGVAGRLAQATDDGDGEKELGVSPKSLGQDNTTHNDNEAIEISFLSTARAGTVIVKASQLEKAVEALEYGMQYVADPKA